MNNVELGASGRLIPLFIQDATVSTGAGLPNLEISTFSSYYHRSDMTSTSSVTLVSTGTLGTWSSGQFLQINSTFMRGWYQFACPDGMFVNGSTVALHMYGHPLMAPVVKAIDINRLSFQSSVINTNRVGVSSFGLPVGVSSFGILVGVSTAVGVSSFGLRVGVSSFNSPVGVSSFGLPVGVSSIQVPVDVTSFYGLGAVTTADGILGVGAVGVSSFALRVGVSSFSLPVGVSSFGLPVGISSIQVPVDVTSFYGSALVTSAAGIAATFFDLSRILNSTSTVTLPNFQISTQSVTIGSVDVTSFFGSALVTSAAGVLGTHVTTMRIAVDAQIVDRLLNRNVSSGADGGRTVAEALYPLRNRTEFDRAASTLSVYQTDDATLAYTLNVSTTAGDPISAMDPS